MKAVLQEAREDPQVLMLKLVSKKVGQSWARAWKGLEQMRTVAADD
jgi:hypothetical protein